MLEDCLDHRQEELELGKIISAQHKDENTKYKQTCLDLGDFALRSGPISLII